MAKKTILLITTPAMGKSSEVKRLKKLGYSVMDFDIKGTKPGQMSNPEEAKEVMQKANYEFLTNVGKYYDFIAIHANALNFSEIVGKELSLATPFFKMFEVVFFISHTFSHSAPIERIARRDGADSRFYHEACENYGQWVESLERDATMVMERAYKCNKDHPVIFWDTEGNGFVESVTKQLLTAEYDENADTVINVSKDYWMEIADNNWKLYFESIKEESNV